MPGASLAVLRDGDVSAAASGILNLGTGVEATVDSLFQIGSITKVWTATVVMQLVDEGLVELEHPSATYVPGRSPSRTARPRRRRSRCGTAHAHERHRRRPLRGHGRGDDVLEKYVASCAGLAPGAPARGDDVVLQHRLLRPRPPHRDRHGRRSGTRRIRSQGGRAARADAHGHAPRGRAPLPRRDRPHPAARPGAAGRSGLGASAICRARGRDLRDRVGGRSSSRALHLGAGKTRAGSQVAERRVGPRRCRSSRSSSQRRHRDVRPLLGPRLVECSSGTAARCSGTTAARSVRPRSCASSPMPASLSRCSRTEGTHRALPRARCAPARETRRRRDARRGHAARAAARVRRAAVSGRPTSVRGRSIEVVARDDGMVAVQTVTASARR